MKTKVFQPLPSDKVEHLFDCLQLMYGRKFMDFWMCDNDMLEAGKRFWDSRLAEYSDEKIKKAIQLCEKEKPWPPTLPEFIELCERKPVSLPDWRKELPPPDYSNRSSPEVFTKQLQLLKDQLTRATKDANKP